MKEYPSISGFEDLSSKIGEHCFCIEKLDGSNIRAEWTKKAGWAKFGSRTRLLDTSDPILGPAIPLFMEKYAEPLQRIFLGTRSYKEQGKATVFFEFLGKSSFAGTHVPEESKDVVLFDVDIHKKGFIDPKEFIKNFGTLHIPELVCEGPLTKDLIDSIRNGIHPFVAGTEREGVIFKGGHGHQLWFRKLKTLAYLNKLKNTHPKDWEKYV